MRPGTLSTQFVLLALWLGVSVPAWAVCGPGQHWVDDCAIGAETIAVKVTISIDTPPFDGVPNGNELEFEGNATILRGDPSGTPDPLDPGHLNQIVTEVVSLTLSGSLGISITGGDGVPNLASDGPLHSPGVIVETPGVPSTAVNSFDLFLQLSVPLLGLTLHNEVGLHVESNINGIPPVINSTSNTAVPLVNAQGEEVFRVLTATITGGPGAARNLTQVSGNGQSGSVNQPLADLLVVQVTDEFGNGVSGTPVNFQVTAGFGSVSPGQAVTNAQGLASTVLTLGPAPGNNTVTATSAGLTGSPVTFVATGAQATATNLSLANGNNQAGISGRSLANPLVVRATDIQSRPTAGVSITFAVTEGGGSVFPTEATTDALGQASTVLTLGPGSGTNTVTATSGTLAGSPVTFTATAVAVAGPAAKLVLVSGDNQTGTAGSPLPSPLVVRVTDAIGIPVSGVAVTFAVTAGGGALLVLQPETDEQGEVSATWILGPLDGTNTAMASSGTLEGSPVTFTALGFTGSRAANLSLFSGNQQEGLVGETLAAPLTVQVADVFGFPVFAEPVIFRVAAGGGTLTGGVTELFLISDFFGFASVELTLGPQPSTAQPTLVVASAGTLNGSPVTFTATARNVIPGPLAALDMVSGNNQAGVVQQALASPFVVKVTDASEVPVGGATVIFTVTKGTATLSVGRTSTTVEGEASSTLFLSADLGTSTVVATVEDLPGSSVEFTATAVSPITPILPPDSVVNGANFRPAAEPDSAIAPGSIVAVFGTNLTGGALPASSLPLPIELMGTSVTLSGIPLPLFSVSGEQINALVPFDVPLGPVSVEVKRDGIASFTQTATVSPTSPGIFTINQRGTGQGAVLIGNTAVLAAPSGSVPGREARPAQRGDFISIFCSGLGAVTNLPPDGQAATGADSITITPPTVTIGGVAAPVSFSGLAGFVGLYQVDVQVPEDSPTGDAVELSLAIGGVQSNTVTVAVQ